MAKVLALIAHVVGIAIAAVLIYFLAPLFAGYLNQDEWAVRTALFVFLALWGLWTAIQILRGKDSLAVKLEQHIKKNGRL